jgi:hypothetical protein
MRRHVDLAGERFRGEADRLEKRLWGESGTKHRYSAVPREQTGEAAIPLRD